MAILFYFNVILKFTTFYTLTVILTGKLYIAFKLRLLFTGRKSFGESYMPRVSNVLVSYCGVVCEYCPAYRKKLCPGCDPHVDECEYIKCAINRNVKSCLLCSRFPCSLHEEGFEWATEEYGKLMWKIYSDIFLWIMNKTR